MAAAPYVIGSDEVGYGAWAGPLVVCAVAVEESWSGVDGLTDSKKMTLESRARTYALLQKLPMALRLVEAEAIDRIGALPALVQAHTDAILDVLKLFPGKVIVDGNLKLPKIPWAQSVPKADLKYPVVSAASVVAKVNRDYLMVRYGERYPGYGFESHVGYGTREHKEALLRLGVCPIHRKSYRPIAAMLGEHR